jgi:hypothetical protein
MFLEVRHRALIFMGLFRNVLDRAVVIAMAEIIADITPRERFFTELTTVWPLAVAGAAAKAASLQTIPKAGSRRSREPKLVPSWTRVVTVLNE